jgi:hypothetical protein
MSFIKPAKLAALVFIVLTGIVLPTSAQVVVFSSFGPGNSFNINNGEGVTGASYTHGYQGISYAFTPSSTGDLSAIEIGIGHSSGSGRVNFFIAQDTGGIPGNILENYLNVYCPGKFGQSYAPLVLTSTTQPLLEAGTTYWVCAEPADNTSVCAWNVNLNVTASEGFENSPWSWEPAGSFYAGAFAVNVTPVPEPSMAWLSLLGISLFFCRLTLHYTDN